MIASIAGVAAGSWGDAVVTEAVASRVASWACLVWNHKTQKPAFGVPRQAATSWVTFHTAVYQFTDVSPFACDMAVPPHRFPFL